MFWFLNCMLFIDRTGHGMATFHPTSTWTPSSTSSCPVFCREAGKDASSSPASTQTSAPCKHRKRLTIFHSLRFSFQEKSSYSYKYSRCSPTAADIFFHVFPSGCVKSRTCTPSSSWLREFPRGILQWWTSAARPLRSPWVSPRVRIFWWAVNYLS